MELFQADNTSCPHLPLVPSQFAGLFKLQETSNSNSVCQCHCCPQYNCLFCPHLSIHLQAKKYKCQMRPRGTKTLSTTQKYNLKPPETPTRRHNSVKLVEIDSSKREPSAAPSTFTQRCTCSV